MMLRKAPHTVHQSKYQPLLIDRTSLSIAVSRVAPHRCKYTPGYTPTPSKNPYFSRKEIYIAGNTTVWFRLLCRMASLLQAFLHLLLDNGSNKLQVLWERNAVLEADLRSDAQV